MCLTFLVLLARNVSLKVFIWQLCCRVWRCSVYSLFNLREIAVSKTPVHFYHNSSYRCFFLFCSNFDSLSGSRRLEWICPWAISSLFALPLLSVSLSIPLTTSTPLPLLLPLSHSPPTILSLSVETIKPISFSDTFTGCPGWTMTQEPGFPKTVTWFKAANKLAANYLSNTCWWRR